ncbi:MAG: hypothetical protein WBL61_23700, partial [Bryobacteraceae bacterium]
MKYRRRPAIAARNGANYFAGIRPGCGAWRDARSIPVGQASRTCSIPARLRISVEQPVVIVADQASRTCSIPARLRISVEQPVVIVADQVSLNVEVIGPVGQVSLTCSIPARLRISVEQPVVIVADQA